MIVVVFVLVVESTRQGTTPCLQGLHMDTVLTALSLLLRQICWFCHALTELIRALGSAFVPLTTKVLVEVLIEVMVEVMVEVLV